MKIVIDIPKSIYEYMQTDKYDRHKTEYFEMIIPHSIKNGTPLPKGHGDLKDIGKCNRKLFYQQCGGVNSLITVKTAFDMLLSLPTIIEADKAESEDKE